MGIKSKISRLLFLGLSAFIVVLTSAADYFSWGGLVNSGNQAGAVVGFLLLSLLMIPVTIVAVIFAVMFFAAAID